MLAPTTLRSDRHLNKNVRIDMTPMVDLGFLLISFFIFTTTLQNPVSFSLNMPNEGEPMAVKQSHVITALLGGNDKVYEYEGTWDEAKTNNKIKLTGYNEYKGLGYLIRNKQKRLATEGAKDDLMFIIKPFDQSSYKNVVDALDEAIINNVKKYAIVKPEIEEISYSISGINN